MASTARLRDERSSRASVSAEIVLFDDGIPHNQGMTIKTISALLLLAVGCSAQPRLDPPTIKGTVPCILAYLPPGTNPGGRLLAACIPLGPGLSIVNSAITAPPTTAVSVVSHVERFPLASFAPFPTDGSDKTVSVTLSRPALAGSALMAYTSSQGFQPFAIVAAAGSATIQVTIGPNSYGDAAAELVISYLAGS